MSAGDEDVWEEIRSLRRRLDAAEAVLAIHELKARYGDLVDSRFERGRLESEDERASGADGVWRHERMTLTTVLLAPSSDGWGRIFT